MVQVLGLDIGGANLKAATAAGQAVTLPFPLWKQPDKLTGGLIDLLLRFPESGPIAVTMTGELCDCFPDKASGVRHILQAVRASTGERPLYIWRNDGKWAGVQHALEDPRPVAAANWLAAAAFSGRYLPAGPGWFLDLGSTTFDLIPLHDGVPLPRGRSDLERLNWGELAYVGASRTPICAVVDKLLYDNAALTPAAELFATVQDVYVLTGHLEEDTHDMATADGRPRTKQNARRRLARMLCADAEELEEEHFQELLFWITQEHQRKIHGALEQAFRRHGQEPNASWGGVVLAGSGEWLLGNLKNSVFSDVINWHQDRIQSIISMTKTLGPALSSALCAHGAAVLLAERLGK
jgi:probable H4MPT-linked C1 transfer pathway protein